MGSGEPIIILHGLFGLSDNWLTIGKKLAEDYQIYILDLRNHGRSPHSKELNYNLMVEDVYEFLTDFNLRTVSLLGHSMGGITAMNFAVEYPHRLNKLIVIDIAPKSYPIFHHSIIKGLYAIDLKRLKKRRQADLDLQKFVPEKNTRQFLLKNLYRNENGEYSWRINLSAISNNLAEIGKGLLADEKFTNPTLFIKGEFSEYIHPSDVSLIKQSFPNAIIKTISGASHWVHADAPDETLSIVRDFINE